MNIERNHAEVARSDLSTEQSDRRSHRSRATCHANRSRRARAPRVPGLSADIRTSPVLLVQLCDLSSRVDGFLGGSRSRPSRRGLGTGMSRSASCRQAHKPQKGRASPSRDQRGPNMPLRLLRR